ncbi:hypothetical protein COJ85_03105 [Bacillus sp. AFS076308]|uniref:hypothetical protein n=1 Tax=unclassified Bacillus (in: firmicutes) TaxID=185979 RepID=UPI000BF53ED0|nr:MULTISPECIES: hypothetical protein [unclassified Bacillus (in: firmicutes)]PFO08494.1 hypothetical protein COJ85_03105 [Bacillus sp. AFS076308]PGV54693.1 hypothetical protein COD92_04015 [Bacillus sp. AFS037270]
MTVNHASTLKKEYFLSYINLVMISRNCSLQQAKELTIELFFKNNYEQYGKQTYERFIEAFKQLSKTEN